MKGCKRSFFWGGVILAILLVFMFFYKKVIEGFLPPSQFTYYRLVNDVCTKYSCCDDVGVGSNNLGVYSNSTCTTKGSVKSTTSTCRAGSTQTTCL